MAPHDWCAAHDVGIMLGGLHTPTVATLIWKNPDYPARSTRPLRIKCVLLPQTSRHPETGGYPSEGQSCAKCRGDPPAQALHRADGAGLGDGARGGGKQLVEPPQVVGQGRAPGVEVQSGRGVAVAGVRLHGHAPAPELLPGVGDLERGLALARDGE